VHVLDRESGPTWEYAPEFGAHRDMTHTDKIGRPGTAHSDAMGYFDAAIPGL